MDTKTTENETNETIKSQQENEESSYQIPAISFEDSQVDHFVPYSSPSVLNWDTRKTESNNDLSDIELVRGGDGAAGSSGIELSSELSQKPIDENDEEGEHDTTNNYNRDNDDTATNNETVPLEKYESTLKTLANIDVTATEIHIDSTTNVNENENNETNQSDMQHAIIDKKDDESDEPKQQSLSDLINQIELNVPESNDEDSNQINDLNEQTSSNMIIETIQQDKLTTTTTANEKQFNQKPKLETMSSQSNSSTSSSSDSTSYKAINANNNKLNNNQDTGKTYILNERKLADSKTNDRFKLLSAVSNDIDIDFYNIDENNEINNKKTRKDDLFDGYDDYDDDDKQRQRQQRQSHSSNDDCMTQSTGKDAVTTIKDSDDQLTQPSNNINATKNKINDNKFTSNMLNLSSQSSNSSSASSSNAASLDSLAKRVQDLIGPIKLDTNKDQTKLTSSSKTAPAPPQTTTTATSTSLYAQIIQNNGKLPSSYVFKKQFDHNTIQKDLDYITNSLKRTSSISTNASTEDYDKQLAAAAASNNVPISNINETKPNKEIGTRKSVKSSLDFETPKVKLDLLSTNTNTKPSGLQTTSGRDLLYETPMRNSTYIPQQAKQNLQTTTTTTNNTTSNSYSIYNNNVMYSTTPLIQQTDKLTTHIETPASYNMLFGKANSIDYHSSTMYYDNKGTVGGIYGKHLTATTTTKTRNLHDNRDDFDYDYDRVKHTATSPIKFDYTLTETLSKSDYYKTLINDNHTIDMPPPQQVQPAPSTLSESRYKRVTTKSPTRSAFDDDPEVIKAKYGLSVTGASTGATTTTTTIAASAKYVPLKTQNETFKSDSSMMRSLDTLSYTTNSLYNQQSAHNFNAFDKANSKLMTQLRDAMNRSPMDRSGSVLNNDNKDSKFVDLQPHKPNANITPNSTGSGLTTVTSIGPQTASAVPPGSASIKQLDSTQNSQQTETIESTHTGSDDARGPRFPPHVYGSREDPQINKISLMGGTKNGGTNGVLYERRNNNNSNNNNNQVNQDTPRSERSEDNSLLDADNLKKMDKNLKKLMKKEEKLKDSQLRNMDNVVCREYAVAWDINFDDIEQIIASENAQNKNNDSTLNSTNSDLIVTHPYLPLRDVPMNDLVKKLQHEFELDGDAVTVPPNMQRYWEQMKQQQQQNNNKENINNEENIKKLEKLFQNPLKTIIQQTTSGEERSNKMSNSQSYNNKQQQEKNVETKGVQVMVPSPQETKQICAAATQTSFIIENNDDKHVSSKRMKKLHQMNSMNEENDETENANSEQIERHRAKMRAIIRKQKQEHEKRCKALEKLAKLERLQAEKLKKMMLMNQSDDQTSFLTNSYLQDTTINTDNQNSTTTTLNETSDDDTTIKMHEQIRKLEAKFLSKYKSSKQNLPKSYVQVLNLKNTSVHEPPEGYYVVKEKPDSSVKQVIEKPIVSKNTQMQQRQRKQTNELHADEDGRLFVSIPGGGLGGGGGGGGPSNVTNSSIHASKSAQNIRPQNTAWFQPVTLVSETTREPFRKQQSVQTPFQHHHHNHHNQLQQHQQSLPSSLRKSSSMSVPILSRSRSRERQATRSPVRFADELVTHKNPIQQEIQEIKGLKKLSLQEAFEMFNFEFISRSRKRLKEIKLRADERRHEEEFKRERIELGIDTEGSNPTASILRRNQLALQHHPLSDNLHLAQRRQMTVEQIKEQTQKVYKNLPEVKERMRKQKVEEDRKRNRIKTSIYKRTIQQRVLQRGPNFKLDFKALE